MPAPRPPVVRIDGDDVRLSRSRYPLHGLECRNGQQRVSPEMRCCGQIELPQAEKPPVARIKFKMQLGNLLLLSRQKPDASRCVVHFRTEHGCGDARTKAVHAVNRVCVSPVVKGGQIGVDSVHQLAGGFSSVRAIRLGDRRRKPRCVLPADGGSCQRAGTGSRPPGVVVFLHGLPSVCVKRNHGFSFLRIQIVLRIVPCRSDRCACGEAQEPPVFVKRSQCNPVYPVSPPGFSAEAAYITIREFYLTSHAASSVSRIGLQNPSPVNCLSAPRPSMKTCSPRWKSTALPI